MGLGSLLGGKTKTYKADPLAGDINAAGKRGLDLIQNTTDQLNENFYNDPQGHIQSQIGLENKMLRGAAGDSSRRLSQLISKRGMGNSSIGIGQQINNERNLNEKIALNNATSSSRLKDLLNEKMGVGQNLWSIKASQGPVQMQDIKQKQGGLAPLIGAGLGGYLGGTGGAKVGMGLGQYFAS